MGASRSTIPKGFDGKVKQDQQVVLLQYGYKKGGIVRIFETPAVPGEDPIAFVRKINSAGFFHDVKRGDWKLHAVTIKGILVVPTTQSDEALKVALQELAGK
jgi:hypothetical protein